MKLVINIPEDEYSWLKEHPNSIRWSSVYTDSILNGTPLGSLVYDIKKEIDDYPYSVFTKENIINIIDKHFIEKNEWQKESKDNYINKLSKETLEAMQNETATGKQVAEFLDNKKSYYQWTKEAAERI